MTNKKDENDNLFCSFCGKSQKEVNKLIAGPAVYICDECIQLCSEIIEEESEKESDALENLMVPKEIKSQLDEYVIEQEAANVTAPGINATPDVGQLVGTIAPFEKSSDENLRLGVEIHGFLAARADVDVYSFLADGGTEIWADIDHTSTALDTIIELIDSNGVVIARSRTRRPWRSWPNSAALLWRVTQRSLRTSISTTTRDSMSRP